MSIINIINNEEVTKAKMLSNPEKYVLPTYLLNKIRYLNSFQYQDNTKENLLRVFINYILEYEMYRSKDLCFFTEKEILNILDNIDTSSVRVKKNLESLINAYFEFNITNGVISKNTMSKLLKNNNREVDKDELKNKYISIDECFRIYKEIVNKTVLSEQDAIIVLLARYSITSEEMVRIKPDDIDRENNRLIIRDDSGNVSRYVTVDNRMVTALDEAIATTTFSKGRSTRFYIDNGFILKSAVSVADKGSALEYHVVRRRCAAVMKAVNMDFITIKVLNKNYLIDKLIELNNEKGCLYNEDIKDVMKSVNREGNSSYFAIKEDLSIIRPDIKVINRKSGRSAKSTE